MSEPVYIVCGGTGGHLAPGIATAQRLMDQGIRTELIVSEKEVDSRLLQAYPEIPYRTVKGAPFSVKPVAILRFLAINTWGIVHGFRYMRKYPPSAIIAFGGFLSVSYMLAGRLLKIPMVLHEANRIAGKSVRFLSRVADMVFLPEGVTLPGVQARRIRRLGMPLRREIIHISKDIIRRRLDIPLHAKVLVVAGGSQGAKVLNDWVARNHKSLAADGIWVILVAGPGKCELPDKLKLKSDQGMQVEIRSFAFHNRMHELFSCADVVLSRAGAGSIAELVTCLTPSILVPYPHAAEDHQLANARYLERRGGGVLIEQREIMKVYREVLDLIYNDWLLGRMRDNLRRLDAGDPAEELARYVIKTHVQDGLSRLTEHVPGTLTETGTNG